MSTVFQIEEIVEQIFEQVCPLIGPKQRAFRPLLTPVLGELMPDSNVRELVRDREYFRIDFADFVDYATSTLPPEPTLGRYPDGRAFVYEGIARRPEEPLFTTNWSGKDFGISILDAIVARSRVFVSVTTRLLIYRDPLATYRQQYGDLDPDDVAGATAITTIVFAAKPISGDNDIGSDDYANQTLEEWDRYYIMPPVPGDLEWRFALSGTYTESFLDECLQYPKRLGALTSDQVSKVRAGGRENETTHSVEFELGRLALDLPSYIRFMYDLVVREKIPVSRGRTVRRGGRGKIKVGDERGTKYRVIKSVRVVRPDSGGEEKFTRKSWSPPARAFAVRGHWRALRDSNRTGRDRLGNSVQGKTWIRDYNKGHLGPLLSPTSSEVRSSPVVVNIKQSLSYGRDFIQSQSSNVLSPKVGNVGVATEVGVGPSAEWRSQERAKLTAGLRYFILRRDNFRCRLCGRCAADEMNVRLEVDHILSIDQWGKTEESNLWALCHDCNRGKGTDSLKSS